MNDGFVNTECDALVHDPKPENKEEREQQSGFNDRRAAAFPVFCGAMHATTPAQGDTL
jgi:hypothetical protein